MSSSKPVALITGASSGIGAVYANRLAERGYDLVLVARRADRLHAISEKLTRQYEVEIRTLKADLTVENDLVSLEDLLRSDERIALLVNNAGNGKLSSTVDMCDVDANATLALNIVAPTRLARAVLPGFVKRNTGAIINIGSVMAFCALPITTLYSATKSYLLTFSQGLKAELAETGVRVQAVLPAGTATEFYDHAGIPLSAFDQAAIMTTENLVDAALAGFDQGEDVTLPSVHDAGLWSAYENARSTLFRTTQTGVPAPRYKRT
ncbi:SDR family NAD(P)-dependent oxidoreductase [Gluconobacter cerinus]|uniref:SDR family NAD(P)-dependent oxidoreductase n=1 Tax=Gluconobacter cerinus TaxID=38307 RepID=UPI001B8B6A23|nr:SDR family oxidoreductase [Gluconobacter cerinus]MBS1048776.1 SDR family oxidoreductase [Gluconobacter cerinus]